MLSEPRLPFSSPIVAPADALSKEDNCPPLLPPFHFSPAFDSTPSPTRTELKIATPDHAMESTLSKIDRSSSHLDVQIMTENMSLNHVPGGNPSDCDVELFSRHQKPTELLSEAVDPVPPSVTRSSPRAQIDESRSPATESPRTLKEENIEMHILTPVTRLNLTTTVEIIDLTLTDDETDDANDISIPIQAVHSDANPGDGTPDPPKIVDPLVLDRDTIANSADKEEELEEHPESVVGPEKIDVDMPEPRVDEVPAIPLAKPDALISEPDRGVANDVNLDNEISAVDHIVSPDATVHVGQVNDPLPVASEHIREALDPTFPEEHCRPEAPLMPELAGIGSPSCSAKAVADEMHTTDGNAIQNHLTDLPPANGLRVDVDQEIEVKIKDEPEESTGKLACIVTSIF